MLSLEAEGIPGSDLSEKFKSYWGSRGMAIQAKYLPDIAAHFGLELMIVEPEPIFSVLRLPLVKVR